MPMQISISNSIKGEPSSGGAAPFENLYSFEFDGITDYIQSVSTYSELDGQTKATFSCWIKPTTDAVNRNIFHIGNGATSGVNGVCQLWIRQGSRIDFSIDTSSYYGRADISTINYDAWNHILIAIDLDNTDEFKCYVNGSDATTSDNLGSRTSFSTATESLLIGEMGTGQYDPFLGNIDEFAIWSGTDLRNDVATIYNGGVPNDLNNNGLTAPTTWYRMGDAATWTGKYWDLIDQGSGGNDGFSGTLPAPPAQPSTDVPT